MHVESLKAPERHGRSGSALLSRLLHRAYGLEVICEEGGEWCRKSFQDAVARFQGPRPEPFWLCSEKLSAFADLDCRGASESVGRRPDIGL